MPNREHATRLYMSTTRVSNVLDTVSPGRPAWGLTPPVLAPVDRQLGRAASGAAHAGWRCCEGPLPSVCVVDRNPNVSEGEKVRSGHKAEGVSAL